ncbi:MULTISPECIES: hypothetical protein [Bacteria]|uniref:Uncharacterized protein n=3 Tax=Bacteria TaxID=2 RepID=A0A1I4UIG6_9BURK|nr:MULTISPECIES: hypothetical protein [Bacteria]RKT85633.1 hypothetical protein ATL45_3980 [Saccharopolyspora antimicrobica]SFE69612.1 hypothetical protein SAMN05216506_113178 [Saccharopolyspora kobensis]SFM88784.1 hypothetical protein SAMN02982985_05670 [Rugamonas rubra]SFO85692.1 hypothetical protein SAMN05421805_12764 [Saccharopolyspora antimicrobica]
MTREEAIAAAGAVLARARVERDALPPREAAELAYYPGGPSLDQIEQEIRAMRRLPAAA